MDGNIGIGGSPEVLLRRVAGLIAADGQAIVELDRPGARSELVDLRLRSNGAVGNPFPWAHVAAHDAARVAARAGLRARELWEEADRWFATLVVAG
jgi:hypothetical protein